ncbi:hypothetical protein F2Q69_00005963 [Brassica cretica]|uniref:Uncharacterized protein n=2 Tax=Brassica cretica TaxID=69181 RepID=A0A8S9PIP9_BRACR|nr:hypothetical protein F2Q69_00005963 [Brassica cretica]
MVGVIRLSPGVDQNRNMIKSGKGRGSRHDLLGVGPMVGMHGRKKTEQSVRTHGGMSSLKIGTYSLGLGWCIEWLGDWLNLLRLEYADPNLESWTSGTSHVFVWLLDGPSTVVEVAKMDHEKTKSRSGNRPRDLVRLNKMKRESWTSDETAGRCENEARSAGRSSDKLSVAHIKFSRLVGQ